MDNQIEYTVICPYCKLYSKVIDGKYCSHCGIQLYTLVCDTDLGEIHYV